MTTLASAAGKGESEARAGAFLVGLMGLSNGQMAEEFVKQKYPNIPPGLSCPYVYWLSILNPPNTMN